MSALFRWFKDIKVEIDKDGYVDFIYIDGDWSPHSFYNRYNLQKLFHKKFGIYIPTLSKDYADGEDYEFNLIKPEKMMEYCKIVLLDKECDEYDLRERIYWIKRLSEWGYYVAYEPN